MKTDGGRWHSNIKSSVWTGDEKRWSVGVYNLWSLDILSQGSEMSLFSGWAWKKFVEVNRRVIAEKELKQCENEQEKGERTERDTEVLILLTHRLSSIVWWPHGKAKQSPAVVSSCCYHAIGGKEKRGKCAGLAIPKHRNNHAWCS